MKTYKTKRRLVTRAATTVLNTLLLVVVFQAIHSNFNSCLLAGNVTASIDRQGDLEIRGDNDRDGNQLEMTTRDLANGQIVYLLLGKNGTMINGRPEDQILYDEVTGNINIRMGYRDDRLDLHFLHVKNNLNIDTGNGDDDVMLNAMVGKRIQVYTRGGDDYVWSHWIICGISEANARVEELSQYDGLIVDTGNGRNDSMWLLGGSVFGNTELSSGTGTNVFFIDRVNAIGNVDIVGRAGQDFVYMFDLTVRNNVDIDLGSQSDFLFMDVAGIKGTFNALTGSGNDFVHGRELTVDGRSEFDGGHGRHDYLQLIDGDFANWHAPVRFEHQRHVP